MAAPMPTRASPLGIASLSISRKQDSIWCASIMVAAYPARRTRAVYANSTVFTRDSSDAPPARSRMRRDNE